MKIINLGILAHVDAGNSLQKSYKMRFERIRD